MGEEKVAEEVFNSDALAEELKADGLELPENVSAEENPPPAEEVKKEEADENVIEITPEEGDKVTIEKGKELPEGVTAEMLPDTVMLDEKGIIVDVPPEPVGWKHGDQEYKPDELLKYIDDAKNARKLHASGTNATKEAAKVERAIEPIFKLAEKLSSDEEGFADLREAVEEQYGEETAKLLDGLAGLKKSELVDPMEAELSERENAIAQKEYNIEYSETMGNIQKDNKLTDDEVKDFDSFCLDYYESMKEDDTIPYRGPEELYKQSPLYEQKLTEKAKAEGIKEAERKQKLKDDSDKIKKKNPPSKSAGSSGGGGEYESVEDLKADLVATLPQE